MKNININEFVSYVMSFYGKDGIYSYDFTEGEILIALGQRMIENPEFEFCGDSVDRESIRDMVLANRDAASEADPYENIEQTDAELHDEDGFILDETKDEFYERMAIEYEMMQENDEVYL